MAHPEEMISLTKAFSGFGVDEKVLISTLGKWRPSHIESYRKANANGEFFQVDEQHLFQRWTDHHVQQIHQQFIRFKNAVVLRTMHPWERDARLIHEALAAGVVGQEQLNVIVETACTRSAEELLGARKAYHSLFHHSIEEHIAAAPPHIINHHHRKLLVALVSAYRYEGSHVVDQETAKSEAKILHEYCCAINPLEEEEDMDMDMMKVIFILATRSKPHLKAIYNHYKQISGGNYLDEDFTNQHSILFKEAVQCLCIPETYFGKVLERSLESINADESAKDTVTRVIVTQADVNLKNIKEEYHNITGVALPKKVEELANGSYRDFLLALLEKE